MSKLPADIELLSGVRDLCEYWFSRGMPTHPSEAEYNSWRALGFGSEVFRGLCSLLAQQEHVDDIDVVAKDEAGQLLYDAAQLLIAELQKDADRYRWLRHMTTKERTYIVQQEYDKAMDMFLDESMKGGRNE